MYCPVGYHGVDRQSTSESPCENAELHCFFRIDALLTPDKSAHGSASDQDLPAAWVVAFLLHHHPPPICRLGVRYRLL